MSSCLIILARNSSSLCGYLLKSFIMISGNYSGTGVTILLGLGLGSYFPREISLLFGVVASRVDLRREDDKFLSLEGS